MKDVLIPFERTMKKITLLTIVIIPGLVSAYRPGEPTDFSRKLSQAAIERTKHTVRYDGRYRKIGYPNGDVPEHLGVCTDVIIRSYRKLGIDLQKDIHEDMRVNFNVYPDFWGLSRPDPNIDHRRVPNLQTLFNRKGIVLPVTRKADDYAAGDLVTWMLPGNLPHIGIIIITAGEWVRYSTPGKDGAEYIAVCLPAFAPEKVHRDE
jgi:hypothetical protein